MTIQHQRPWYCLGALVDDYRTVLSNGGDLKVLRALKILRSIIVNLALGSITFYALVETTADPTIVFVLGVSTLALYNGIEVADYAALMRAFSELSSEQDQEQDRDE